MGAIIFGGFFLLAGAAVAGQSGVLAVLRTLGRRDDGYRDAVAGAVGEGLFIALGWTIIHFRHAEWEGSRPARMPSGSLSLASARSCSAAPWR